MSRTVKFTVSIPEAVFKGIEACRRRTGKSRSQLIREAVQVPELRTEKRPGSEAAVGPSIREGSARYGEPARSIREITDTAERRRRAIAAAGRFRSGAPDLSAGHDRYLGEAYSAVSGTDSSSAAGPGRKT
jgi:Arc/MetJ-type ribon-helix-helix transcriptional regulator